MNQNAIYKGLLLVFLLPIVCIFPVQGIGISKGYQLLSIAILILIIDLFFKKEKLIEVRRFDVFFYAFLGYSFLSSIWAPNSLLAISNTFIYFLFYQFMVIVSSIKMNYVEELFKKKKYFAVIFGYHIILIGLYLFFYGKNQQGLYFGYHQNHFSQYLIVLSIPLYFFKWKLTLFYDFLILIILLVIAVLCKSKGSILFLALIYSSLFLYNNINVAIKIKNLVLSSKKLMLLSFMTFTSICVSSFVVLNLFSDRLNFGSMRLTMIKKSFEEMCKSPFLGIGSGNWKSSIYENGLADFPKQLDEFGHLYYGAHNLTSKIIAELGFPGMLFVSIVFFFIIYKFNNLNKKYIIPFSIFVFFILSTSLYESSYSFEYYYSSFQVIVFLALALFYKKSKVVFKISGLKWFRKISSLLLFFYFLMFFIVSQQHYNIKIDKSVERKVRFDGLKRLYEMKEILFINHQGLDVQMASLSKIFDVSNANFYHQKLIDRYSYHSAYLNQAGEYYMNTKQFIKSDLVLSKSLIQNPINIKTKSLLILSKIQNNKMTDKDVDFINFKSDLKKMILKKKDELKYSIFLAEQIEKELKQLVDIQKRFQKAGLNL